MKIFDETDGDLYYKDKKVVYLSDQYLFELSSINKGLAEKLEKRLTEARHSTMGPRGWREIFDKAREIAYKFGDCVTNHGNEEHTLIDNDLTIYLPAQRTVHILNKGDLVYSGCRSCGPGGESKTSIAMYLPGEWIANLESLYQKIAEEIRAELDQKKQEVTSELENLLGNFES